LPTSGGQFNPAVTLGFLITGKMKPLAVATYIFAQLVGGLFAALAVYLLVMDPAGADASTRALSVIAQTTPRYPAERFWFALLAEMVGTGLLVFVIWGTIADPRARNISGLAIGLTWSGLILAVGAVSGACLNPARSFGPALLAGLSSDHVLLWNQQTVYWLGPLVGGGIAAILYHLILWPRDRSRQIDPDSQQVPPTQRP
jgi:aquaporin Z